MSITIKNVVKRFGNFLALDNVSLDVPDGALLALLGPSGSGKTTLLRIISGLEAPDSGAVLYQDEDVTDAAVRERNVGFVFQHYALFRHMTVFDNIAFGLRVRKRPRAQIRSRVMELLRLVQLEGLERSLPSQLSGGQRQRVALGRAIVRHPQVFLFDEPLSNLDAKLRVQMRVELKKLHDRLGTTAIYVTHDQVEAMTLGDRVVVMKDGLVQQVGEPLELYNEPANLFVAGFLGSPAMNFAPVTVSSSDSAVWVENEGMRIKPAGEAASRLGRYVGQEVTLGIRPEDLHVASAVDPQELGFDATIEVIEKLGSEILLDMAVGPHTMVASVDPGIRVNVHDRLRLALNPERLHFFDTRSEAVI